MRNVIIQVGIVIAIAVLPQSRALAQPSPPSPSVQLTVSNMLSRLTNDEAKAAFKAKLAAQFPEPKLLPVNEFTGRYTNGPAFYFGKRAGVTNFSSNAVYLEVHRQGYPTPPLSTVDYFTNKFFDHFAPQSLNNLTWTNFIAHTNGRTTQIWSVRSYQPGWPATPPLVRWNTNSIMWGMRGSTAICPCWQGESGPGQAPITALTRRHGYTRGHGIGSDGFGKLFLGGKIWFLTLDNKLVEVTVLRTVVRTASPGSDRDYTILLFSKDLPDSITPLRVVSAKMRLAKYAICDGAPCVMYMTEQTGHVSAEVPGFTVETVKPMDSGSPNLLPLPGELVFCGGRTTSPASEAMQADMDELCRLSNLNPANYQMQWVDLSAYPSY